MDTQELEATKAAEDVGLGGGLWDGVGWWPKKVHMFLVGGEFQVDGR